jgi:DNA recombination protein RmuC
MAVLLALGALIAGVLVGWLLAGRSAAPLKTERDEARSAGEEWRLKFSEAVVNLASEAEKNKRLTEVEAQLATEREAATTLKADVAAYRRGEEEREKAFEARLAELKEAKDALSAQFSEIGGKLLNEAQKSFLERADARFQQAGETNEQKLKNLLQPVEATLKRYEESLGEIEKARNASYGELKQAVAQLAQGNDQVRRETQRLANVMVSSPKARGRWGEEQLRTILESAGLAENIDFTLQSSVSDGERTLRPDCVINLPGGRCIVVDVKCPLVAFEQAYDEEDEEKRARLLLQHAGALKSYANDLGRKAYWRQFDLSPDFVIMFVPGEHFLAAAAERAPELIESAFRNGVIVASTINMLALAKIMAGMWRQETLAAQAQEIAAEGKELHARLQSMGAHVFSLGRNLRLATDSYNDFVGSLDRKVMSQAKRFEELKVAVGNKPIVDLPTVDFTPKISTKLLDQGSSDDESQIAAE